MSLFDTVGYEEEDSPRPPRRRRQRRLAVTLVVLVVLLAGGAAAALGVGVHRIARLFASAPDYSGNGYGSVVVQVHDGDTSTNIANTLYHDDVVKSARAFVNAANDHPQSRSVAPGYYRLHHHMAALAALRLLLNPAARVSATVVVPDGFTSDQILARIAARTNITLTALQAALQDPTALGLPPYAHGQAEGFLYPATYSIDPGTTATQALAAMVARFNTEAAAIQLPTAAQAVGHSPYDVVIVASLIEREARLPQDYAKVARVIYNRLAIGMPLELDSTVLFALHSHAADVSIADTKVASPYNTYLHKGLPPTPISSPGDQALQAALHPAAGSWLYFITIDTAGHTAFANTYQQFLSLKARADQSQHAQHSG